MIEFTDTDGGDFDFDRATMTVRGDDGERVSVWDLDDCPLCNGRLIFSPGVGGGPDVLMCRNAVVPPIGCDLILYRGGAL